MCFAGFLTPSPATPTPAPPAEAYFSTFRYLHSRSVDFTRRNNGGNDPLNHAVAYGRRDLAAWLLEVDDGDGVRETGTQESPGAAMAAAAPVPAPVAQGKGEEEGTTWNSSASPA